MFLKRQLFFGNNILYRTNLLKKHKALSILLFLTRLMHLVE